MHKNNLPARSYFSHVLFWMAVYAFWVVVFRSYSISLTKTMTIEFCYLIFITADYYIINYFIVPAFLFKRKYILFVTGLLGTILLSAWGRSVIALNMRVFYFHIPGKIDFPDLFLHSLINISLWILLITVGKMMIERLQAQSQLETLEKERVKNELDYLKAQINPHALFNSLNTIYGHIEKNNQVARNTLLQFSELLRYQLYDCAEEKVSLDKEIEYINNFISFHKLRKDENLVVGIDFGHIDANLQIAPLLLVVLLENAFKFVSNSSDKENKICIQVSTVGKQLHCLISNTKEFQESDPGNKSKGIGVANLKRRLELLYKGKYE
ncbi:MAG TPA: histidine kinase, partial [Puia sp.]